MASFNASVFGLQDSSLIKTQGLIDGKWVDAKDASTFQVTNPATLEELATVPDMGLEETKEAIDAAARAFPSWSATTPKYKQELLHKLHNLMVEHHDDLSRLITVENGKALSDAIGENRYSASFLDWYAAEALRTYGDHIPSVVPGLRNVVIKQPVGVVAILTPWNFPSAMITRKLGAALAAGCTAVIKPDPETPFSRACLGRSFPPGVVNIVTTQKNEMCESKIVKKGHLYWFDQCRQNCCYSMAASTLKNWRGNAPFIVFDDANIDEAVTAAIACKFRGGGQTCLAAQVSAFKVGNGVEDGVYTHGPLIHRRALEKVHSHVEDAISRGASVVIGEVLHLANNVDVGLAGYLFSRDVGRVWRVAEKKLEGGDYRLAESKESGIGREGGPRGIDEYMNEKLIVLGALEPKNE
ncbi:Aldehyde/histidinol dehydrogenase [Armillaria luteobubalina]|uniref:Aldehyde/histidinol dehydrogenase n=1 Tax=Armillaria luteobubalina TaxID=153913 RepID=A0AA39PT28_9AGAR|nr:Aldehyde/histidinol dehydrogenase [Armillaria luteobubalina]